MAPIADRETVTGIVKDETCWMIKNRVEKLRDALTESMSVSPFLMPILAYLHQSANFAELGEILVAGHLMVGHSTSFGKLVDEKILPWAFKTRKLDGAFRKATEPLVQACFNEIDHLVPRPGKSDALLSLKASRWTIQLTAAVELNKAFALILKDYCPPYCEIVVGVFAGHSERLTDKYDILRGINRGKQHNVVDLTKKVQVYAGKEFWTWLNNGEPATHEWVLQGILEAVKTDCGKEFKELQKSFIESFTKKFAKHIGKSGEVNWFGILKEING
ncbi:MAG: restriction endonuclease [Candidatus Angelobacter sp.]